LSKVQLPDGRNLRPIVKEAIREAFGVHTCDKRSTRSWIHSEFPEYIIEPGFPEVDELWTPHKRETLDEHAAMVKEFLDEVFSDDSATFISVTTHSGTIRALYLAIDHPDVWVAAGSVIPVVIRSFE
jgi:broad specificity phosphatase PhoE